MGLKKSQPISKPLPPYPIKSPTWSEAYQDFMDLRVFNAKNLLIKEKWFSRSEYTFKHLDYIVKSNHLGSNASDYFHFMARMVCESRTSPSPIRSWYDPNLRIGLESSKFYKQSPATALALRKYIASQFRPSAAKFVYQFFKSKKVYDPCGGWGDRMAGCLATENTELYYCRDVNPLVFLGYEREREELNREVGKKVLFELRGSEIDSPIYSTFDTIFTSPPYYCVEMYDGPDQSYVKHKTIELWLENFLFKMAQNCWNVLDDKGLMIINISDVYTKGKMFPICQPLYNFVMTNLPNAHFVGCIGYEMGKRLNSESDKEGTFCEPMMIFQKNAKMEFDDFRDRGILDFTV
jgi:hypothetical protein